MRLGALGPDGTNSAEVVFKYIDRRRIENPIISWYKKIEDCFDAVDNDEVEKAIVPLLNSTAEAAWVNETLTKLRKNNVMICDEQIHLIRNHLVTIPKGTDNTKELKYIHSKDKVFPQCKKSLDILAPNATKINESSTAAAAEKIIESNDIYRGAIVPSRALELYNVKVLAYDIQDNPKNKTKFIVISKYDSEPTGNDKTSVIFEFKDVKRAALLYDVVKEFALRGISLAYIQSIPKNDSLDDFTFYCDIRAHRKTSPLKEALEAVEKDEDLSYYKILGSYPQYSES